MGKSSRESQNKSRPVGSEQNRTGEGGSGSERQSSEKGDYRVLITPFGKADFILAHIVRSHQRMYGEIAASFAHSRKNSNCRLSSSCLAF